MQSSNAFFGNSFDEGIAEHARAFANFKPFMASIKGGGFQWQGSEKALSEFVKYDEQLEKFKKTFVDSSVYMNGCIIGILGAIVNKYLISKETRFLISKASNLKTDWRALLGTFVGSAAFISHQNKSLGNIPYYNKFFNEIDNISRLAKNDRVAASLLSTLFGFYLGNFAIECLFDKKESSKKEEKDSVNQMLDTNQSY